MVKIKSPYHALFGRPDYAKFMVRPCYIYLQLKMPGPQGTITVHENCKLALECKEGYAAYTESACATEELKFDKHKVDPADMTPLKNPTTEKDPLLKFKSVKDSQQVDLSLAIPVSSSPLAPGWIPNRKACSSSSFVRMRKSFHGKLLTCTERIH